MPQETFNPVDYCFRWTTPEPGKEFGWYEWDDVEAHKQALKARNARKKDLIKQGHKVKAWSSSNALISRGGIGSGKPHIELVANIYHINY